MIVPSTGNGRSLPCGKPSPRGLELFSRDYDVSIVAELQIVFRAMARKTKWKIAALADAADLAKWRVKLSLTSAHPLREERVSDDSKPNVQIKQ
jgi:hypothetical protein